MAGNLFACSGGEANGFAADKPRADETVANRASVVEIAEGARDAIALGAAAKLRLRLREAPPAVAEFTGGEVGHATLENGVLVDGAIDGVPMDREGFVQAALSFGAKLDAYGQQARLARTKLWEDLGRRLGLESRLASAARGGLTSANLELTHGELLSLAKNASDLVSEVDVGDGDGETGGISMTDVLNELRVNDVAFPGGWKGSGVGVFVTDVGAVKTDADCINNSSSRLRIYPGGSPADHPTQVVCLVQKTAPEAKVMYQHATANAGSALPSPADSVPIYVSSQSVSYDLGELTRHYRSADRDFDNRTLTTRIAHFQLSNNQHGNVRTPGIAYNVLTVGAYNTATDTVPDFSNWSDPETGAYKPELVAPGDNLDISPTYLGKNGTSYATPIAAGFAADLMEQFTWLRLRPQLLASYLIVNGIRINSDGGMAGARDGYGRPDYSVAQSGRAFWWDGTNSQFFDASGNIDVTYNLGVTGNYRVALSWLVGGDFVLANNRPNQNLDLYVFNPSGVQVAASTSVTQTHEVLNVVATQTGNYKFRIKRSSNEGGNNVIALVIRRR
ncbi:MAG TPA: S8 family serine peptidase [Polyangiaceae bacterium]